MFHGRDQSARNGGFRWYRWRIARQEPVGIGKLVLLENQLASGVIGEEADHELMGEWPGLRGVIADVGDIQSGLLFHLTVHGALKTFPRLDKSGNEAVKVPLDP